MSKEECKSLDCFDIVIKKANSFIIADCDDYIIRSSIETLEHLHITKTTHVSPILTSQSDSATDFNSVIITMIILSPVVPILLYASYKTYLSLQQYLITRYNHLTTALTLRDSPPPSFISEQELRNLSRRIEEASMIAVETQLTYDLADITLPTKITTYELKLKSAFDNYLTHFNSIQSSSSYSFSKAQYCVDNLSIMKHIHSNRIRLNDIICNIEDTILHAYKGRACINRQLLNCINRAYRLFTTTSPTRTRGLDDDDSEV